MHLNMPMYVLFQVHEAETRASYFLRPEKIKTYDYDRARMMLDAGKIRRVTAKDSGCQQSGGGSGGGGGDGSDNLANGDDSNCHDEDDDDDDDDYDDDDDDDDDDNDDAYDDDSGRDDSDHDDFDGDDDDDDDTDGTNDDEGENDGDAGHRRPRRRHRNSGRGMNIHGHGRVNMRKFVSPHITKLAYAVLLSLQVEKPNNSSEKIEAFFRALRATSLIMYTSIAGDYKTAFCQKTLDANIFNATTLKNYWKRHSKEDRPTNIPKINGFVYFKVPSSYSVLVRVRICRLCEFLNTNFLFVENPITHHLSLLLSSPLQSIVW